MHDPRTVAFEIRYPWRKYRKPQNDFERRYREPLFTIWHVDPERDGTDDSCGYTHPRLSENILQKLRSEAELEYGNFFDLDGSPQTDALSGIYAIFEIIAWRIYRREITSGDIPVILSSACHPYDHLRSWFDGLSAITKEDFVDLFRCVCRVYTRSRRKWWQHPKWHVWHWKLQVHPLQNFKRWAFSRCEKCGKGFKWGESPFSDSWNGKGPSWFKPEDSVFHRDCMDMVNRGNQDG